MLPEILSDLGWGKRLRAGNYCYACHSCRAYLRLADLLPWWHQLAREQGSEVVTPQIEPEKAALLNRLAEQGVLTWLLPLMYVGEQQGYLTFRQVEDAVPHEATEHRLEVLVLVDVLTKVGIQVVAEPLEPPLLFRFPQEMIAAWKTYPLRLPGPKLSRCEHQAPTYLVQSMKRGFVTADCWVCKRADTLSVFDFTHLHVWVACPQCHRQMQPTVLQEVKGHGRLLAGNYGYSCVMCHMCILLAELLPRWDV